MNVKTVNDIYKTYLPNEYNNFSVGAFLKGKKLRIENVRWENVEGKKTIKIDVYIVEDLDGSNEGKFFTLRIDRNEYIGAKELREYRQLLTEHIGYPIIIDPTQDVDYVFFYQQTVMTIVVKNVHIDYDAGKSNIIPSGEKKVRRLGGLGDYRTFDIESFFEENTCNLIGTYFDKGKVNFNVHIDEEDVIIKFSVPVADYDGLPASLLFLSGNFEDIVDSFEFSNTSATRHGTRWTFYFEKITFKPNVVTDDKYDLCNEEKYV
ncbi:hypothetical protein MTR05_12735 [Staphylococcus agnetis]|uniref:hypothetical protein n=1 Tax=Staphylococcus agnetis TaxID=985762 RepID=UPI00208E0CD5|nr:hypothetical protein [Staphylococcus agnetis]MCO4327880.1 hypothetical protein [Staphylococcus agnetis]